MHIFKINLCVDFRVVNVHASVCMYALRTQSHTQLEVFMHIFSYTSMCVCDCVCARVCRGYALHLSIM